MIASTVESPRLASSAADVVADLSRGNHQALAELYDRYGRLAHWLAYQSLGNAALAEEVVQDVFLSLWKNAATFDAGRGTVRSWLLASVRHRCIDLRRAQTGPAVVDLEAALNTAAPGEDVPTLLDARLQAVAVRQAIGSLPDDQRLTVYLAYYRGLTHTQIAAQLRIPLGTVKGRLRLALEKLRLSLRGREPMPISA